MARCDCGSSQCQCAIVQGTGVEITGSGQAADPYVIAANRQDITGQLTVSDTSTLNLARSGEGTDNEPYNINGVVSIGPLLEAGTNVVLTGSGTTLDPYVVAAEVDEITGLIEAGARITVTGTGTTASPYVVAADPTIITGLVTAGTNVTVTGAGTTASPYVINATPGSGPATSIAGLITAGTNVTITGAGTTVSPYQIAVSTDVTPTAITGLITAGSRITLNGTGTTGDPYLINTASIAAQIIAGTNVQRTGSGTTASPYVISSVQSTFNLADVFGTGTATNNQVFQFDTSVSGGRWTARTPSWVPLDPEQRSASLVKATINWDAPSVAVGAQVSTPITVPGVTVGEEWVWHVSGGGALVGLRAWANTTAADEVTLYLSNMTAAAVNLSTRTFNVLGWR